MQPASSHYVDPLSGTEGEGRLEGKVALLVGAGQTPGSSLGNGRAAALLYGREGARVLCADRNLASAEETAEMIRHEGGEAVSFKADVTSEGDIERLVNYCAQHYGRIDLLHNNVGAGLSLGDAPVTEVTAEVFDQVMAVNLRSMVLTCKHSLPLMRVQRAGVILNISSFAAYADYPYIAYKTSKAGVIALTQNLAITNALYNIRANALVPGLIDTPMAVDNRIGVLAATREEVIAKRDVQVPLNQKMGTAWDVAHAALFLCSEEARFITGVALAVDGGQGLRVG